MLTRLDDVLVTRVDVQDLLSRSTDRLSRQNQILKIVKGSDERPNVSALAREFKVARRTIIRDLRELIRRRQMGRRPAASLLDGRLSPGPGSLQGRSRPRISPNSRIHQ